MSEKKERQHSLNFANGCLTVSGVEQVLEVSSKEAHFKLSQQTLTVRGNGLNIIKLDREQGVVQLEAVQLQTVNYRQNGVSLKGIFK